MRDEHSRSLTSEAEIEMLLRDSASCDLFGLPPQNLVENALAAVAEPCAERNAAAAVPQQRQSALIVIFLAAVGLFVAALPSADGRNQAREAANMPRFGLERPRPYSPAAAPYYHIVQAPVHPANEHVISSPVPLTDRAVEAPPRTERRHIEIKATGRSVPRAMWTTTVVSESEQGVVIPVVCTAANAEDDPDGQTRDGVAVVPLQSATTVTSYEGVGQQ